MNEIFIFAGVGVVVLVGGVIAGKKYLDRKKEKKRREEQAQAAAKRAADIAKAQKELAERAAEEKAKDPCADKRDGKYKPTWSKKTCHKHGYFWCPIAKKCMPSSINVNDCGKPQHLL